MGPWRNLRADIVSLEGPFRETSKLLVFSQAERALLITSCESLDY